ncbi:hypothetical protein FSARC_14606 [Fusarium sarcochroum]|uniref:Major facilitator superfamily (MFS) profile domain-containing protein n=1 Tax=Fusarium sarcochroum TaxID=1208366 RepID=A0A8H4SS96_9HYPO|nr:hypothetical protein FSARC_14606 [Fusarium sarcochroum]
MIRRISRLPSSQNGPESNVRSEILMTPYNHQIVFIGTIFGTLIRRLLTNNSLKHPEEESGFDLSLATSAWQYLSRGSSDRSSEASRSSGDAPDNGFEIESNYDDTASSTDHRADADSPGRNTQQNFNHDCFETVIVHWYGRDDLANPINWSKRKKAVVFFIINYTTFTVYMASAIYTPAQDDIQEIFGLSTSVASLGLAIFILGYGTGSLVFAPLSEIPRVGRNAPYLITLVIFILISAPTALSSSFAAMMVLRFLQGFFGSPILSTGGASLSDISDTRARPFALYIWAVFAFAGPSVGAVIAGYSIPHLGWRWSLWEIMIGVGPAVILHMRPTSLPKTDSIVS